MYNKKKYNNKTMKCPWHTSIDREECLKGSPCTECNEQTNININTRTFILSPTNEQEFWVNFAGTHMGNHKCVCLSHFKKGQRWSRAYICNHFNVRHIEEDTFKKSTCYLLTDIHSGPGFLFVQLRPETWIRKSTTRTPWGIVNKDIQSEFEKKYCMHSKEDYKSDIHTACSKSGFMLKPFQMHVLDEMLKRTKKNGMRDLFIRKSVSVTNNHGKLFHCIPCVDKNNVITCTFSRSLLEKYMKILVEDMYEIVPGGCVVLPKGYGKRTIMASYFGATLNNDKGLKTTSKQTQMYSECKEPEEVHDNVMFHNENTYKLNGNNKALVIALHSGASAWIQAISEWSGGLTCSMYDYYDPEFVDKCNASVIIIHRNTFIQKKKDIMKHDWSCVVVDCADQIISSRFSQTIRYMSYKSLWFLFNSIKHVKRHVNEKKEDNTLTNNYNDNYYRNMVRNTRDLTNILDTANDNIGQARRSHFLMDTIQFLSRKHRTIERVSIDMEILTTINPYPYIYIDEIHTEKNNNTDSSKQNKKRKRNEPNSIIFDTIYKSHKNDFINEGVTFTNNTFNLTENEMKRYKIAEQTCHTHDPLRMEHRFMTLLLSKTLCPGHKVPLSKDDAFNAMCNRSTTIYENNEGASMNNESKSNGTLDNNCGSGCSICMEKVCNMIAPIVTVPCKHIFCYECLKMWWCGPRSAGRICPNCRAEINMFVFVNKNDEDKASGEFRYGAISVFNSVKKTLDACIMKRGSSIVIATISMNVMSTMCKLLEQNRYKFAVFNGYNPENLEEYFSGDIDILILHYGSKSAFMNNKVCFIPWLRPTSNLILMEPLRFVPPYWIDSLIGNIMCYDYGSNINKTSVIEIIAKDTIDTYEFLVHASIYNCTPTGYSLEFFDSVLSTVNMLHN